jgi:hypothetical protein
MKFFSMLMVSALMSSVAYSSTCEMTARKIAEKAVSLFKVADRGVHCQAMGELVQFEVLPVIAVLPARYAYEATFSFPCGPQPRTPKVSMLLNNMCQIVNLEMTGHKLR